ncbi:MAG: regulatory iron-sulfur-containing complex subunit RicT [Bacteroidales bacterium]|nr:regulatory iron-sulfur-containing complex subunit RicT [Bacteroidales bacterium]MDY2705626.1 regulatory iron-sulfur-containing complex subunit RicT [Alloprevotella sp.]
MDKEFKTTPCLRGLCARGCGRSNRPLNTYDYLADMPGNDEWTDLVEVQFKNTRKGYFHNENHLPLVIGDMVAVEASPGHDIGVVTLTGQLVPLQMKKANLKPGTEIRRIYRKARPVDLEKYEEAKAREQDTMIRSRQIAKDLELNMKIGDVEYQGDGNKAIFYYIADARVDFRKLIKVLAEEFHVRIEMKQIGARQEAGRIGGFGPCGRELCCATWMKNFNSVSTAAARFQDISPNPQKLAGQCAKLKCCLNYEADAYVEAFRQLPPRDVQLETADSTYFYFKADILAQQVTYSTDKRLAANLVTISAQRAHQIIDLNKAGERPLYLEEQGPQEPQRPIDLVEQEDLTRFDRNRKKKNRKQRDRNERPSRGNQPIEGSANDGQPTEHNDNNERNNRRSNDRRGNNRTRYRNRPGAGDEAR